MHLKIHDLYAPAQVTGPYEREFSDIVVGGDKASPEALFVHAEGTYMESETKMLEAYSQGCRMFIASKFPDALAGDDSTTLIKAIDPVQELCRLAGIIRDLSPAHVIGITGSSGKTTTKDLVAHVLRGRHKSTLKTFRNYNGILGVALTLRKLRTDDRFAVVEIGLGDPGSVEKGAALAKPHTAIITNIGVSHIAKFGSIKNIAWEKGRILAHLQPRALFVTNGDDPWCRELAQKHNNPSLLFGLKRHNPLRATNIQQLSVDNLSFDVVHGCTTQRFTLPLCGEFQVYNSLAAIAIGLNNDFSLKEISERLNTFNPGEQRAKPVKLNRFTVLDDGYNSNPRALSAALKALKKTVAPSANRVAIIGDMQELGKYTQLYYKRLALELRDVDLDHVVLIGPTVAKLKASITNVSVADTATQAAEQALAAIKPGGVLLLKGQDDKLFTKVRQEIERLQGDIDKKQALGSRY